MPTPRRIILTGTPVQNNLEEFVALTNFVVPSAFEVSMFKRVFQKPIELGQDRDATEEQRSLSDSRSTELKVR